MTDAYQPTGPSAANPPFAGQFGYEELPSPVAETPNAQDAPQEDVVDLADLGEIYEDEEPGSEPQVSTAPDAVAGETPDERDQRLAEMERQLYAERAQRAQVAEQFEQMRLGLARHAQETKWQTEWQTALAYAQSNLSGNDMSAYLDNVRQRHNAERAQFEQQVRTYELGIAQQREQQALLMGWLDHLGQKYGLNQEDKNRLASTVSDPNAMEWWASVIAQQRGGQVQNRRQTQRQERRQSNADTVIVHGRPMPRQVKAGSQDHFFALAGDIL